MAEGADRIEILQWFVKTLSDQLSQVFATMAGESPLIEAESLPAAPTDADALVWEVVLNVAPAGPIWLQSPRAGWHGLGNRFLVAAGLDDSDDQLIQDTFKEAMNQAFSGLAREMTGRVGKEVNAATGKLSAASLPAKAVWHKLDIIFDDNQSQPISFGFLDELIDVLSPKALTSSSKAAAAADNASDGGPQNSAVAVQQDNRTMDLLLDVELPISVSFGRAHVPLKEVMKLTTGSIVELNRTISEPVDIIVNNCVIARGEVVVVEGNFGVRINEVISRQERLRTLY